MTRCQGALIIDAVRLPGGGEVGMTHCPGRNHVDAAGRRWNRDLGADLKSIEAWGARALVSLIQKHEFDHLGVPELATRIKQIGLDWYHLPVPDMCAPDDAFQRAWARHGAPILRCLDDGQKIAVHCAGGLGRTGTVAARLLVDFGIPGADAIKAVRRVRPGAIETTAQQIHVLDYASRHREGA